MSFYPGIDIVTNFERTGLMKGTDVCTKPSKIEFKSFHFIFHNKNRQFLCFKHDKELSDACLAKNSIIVLYANEREM